jgi:hypothetical protein
MFNKPALVTWEKWRSGKDGFGEESWHLCEEFVKRAAINRKRNQQRIDAQIGKKERKK